MKSKYFGYTLRGAGTPYQQWVLSDLPVTAGGAYTTTSNSVVAIAGKIPLQSIVFNQIGARVNSDGSICLPQGIYEISYSGILSTAAAGAISSATCRKIDGNLTITPCQIFTPFAPFSTCSTSFSNCGCGCGYSY